MRIRLVQGPGARTAQLELSANCKPKLLCVRTNITRRWIIFLPCDTLAERSINRFIVASFCTSCSRRPLRLARLHQSLKDRSLHKFDWLLLAAILLRLCSRARHCDFSSYLDKGVAKAYVCFEVSHKGARGARQKTQVMSILVPIIGVHGECNAGFRRPQKLVARIA